MNPLLLLSNSSMHYPNSKGWLTDWLNGKLLSNQEGRRRRRRRRRKCLAGGAEAAIAWRGCFDQRSGGAKGEAENLSTSFARLLPPSRSPPRRHPAANCYVYYCRPAASRPIPSACCRTPMTSAFVLRFAPTDERPSLSVTYIECHSEDQKAADP